MTKAITFKQVSTTTRRHEGTGVEIVKVPKKVIGRNGWRVAGYEVRQPEGGQPRFERTLHEALDTATEAVENLVAS